MSGPLLPIPGLGARAREAIAAGALVAGPALVLLGDWASGAGALALAAALLAPRALRDSPGWTAGEARWAPVTAAELARLRHLLVARWRWARDPFHAASAPGLVLLVVLALAAGAAALVLALAGAPGLAGPLALAAALALAPPFLLGAHLAATPRGLPEELAAAESVLEAAAARPEPWWVPVPELFLAPAEAANGGGAVPAGVRVRLAMPGASDALLGATLESVGPALSRGVLRVRPEPAVRAALAS